MTVCFSTRRSAVTTVRTTGSFEVIGASVGLTCSAVAAAVSGADITDEY